MANGKLICHLLQHTSSDRHPLISRTDSSETEIWHHSTRSGSWASSDSDIQDSQGSFDAGEKPWETHGGVSKPHHQIAQVIHEVDLNGFHTGRPVQGDLDTSKVFNLGPGSEGPVHDGMGTLAVPLQSPACFMSEFEVAQRPGQQCSQQVPLPGGTWMQDTQQCAICTVKFGIFARRHHCRRCGRNVCNPCSPFRVRLRLPLVHPSKVDSGSHRVCMGCHR
mmetsp:Transcript_64909/g.125268  ORF Transcript_64909/g.125268 Transcript_64909/m.125268 type:complete len:221 (+) Transcript_64909:37-699(+)